MSIESDVRNFLSGLNEMKKFYFVCETNKNPLLYKAGEEMIFKLSVKSQTTKIPVPYISTEIHSDDGSSSKDIVEVSDDGYFYVKTCCKRDGFVRVIAKALDENKQLIEEIDKFEGGAGADVEKIKLCTPVPDDYFEYWEDLSAQAAAIPKKVIYENDVPCPEGFVAKDMRFETTAGKFLSLTVTYPKDAKEGSLKFKIRYMGYGVGTAPFTCESDCLNVGVNAHDVENFLTPEEYAKIKAERYDRYGFINEENTDPRTSYWHKMYLRDLQAFHYFKDHPLLDGKEFIFMGGSQGAMQACNVALHSKMATACCLNVPWCCDLFAIDVENRMRGWRPDPSEAMKYFDTALAASFLKCPVWIEAGLGDYICPPSGQVAMFNAIKTPKHIRFIQNRTHPYIPVETSDFKFKNSFTE